MTKVKKLSKQTSTGLLYPSKKYQPSQKNNTKPTESHLGQGRKVHI